MRDFYFYLLCIVGALAAAGGVVLFFVAIGNPGLKRRMDEQRGDEGRG